MPLCDEGRGSGALVPPGGGKDTDGLVVAGKAVDLSVEVSIVYTKGDGERSTRTPRLNENQTELGVLVLAVGLKVLADSDGLLDQHVKILWDLGGKPWKAPSQQ